MPANWAYQVSLVSVRICTLDVRSTLTPEIGPNSGSNIFKNAGNDSRANNSLANGFAQNSQTEPFFAMQLGRPREILSATPGTITFGEVLPEFSNITSQPQLPVVNAPALGPEFTQWTVALEGMSVNGQNVTLPPSTADPANPGNFVTLLDTGTALANIPQ